MTYVVIAVVVVFVLLLCFALAVASFSGENFLEKYQENSKISLSYQTNTLEYVKEINKRHFGGRLKIATCEKFRDHYSSGVVALSRETMYSSNITSVAIVSHELGHAKQDFEGDKLKKHWSLRHRVKICGFFFMPAVVAGIVFSLLNVFNILSKQIWLYVGLGFLGVGLLLFLLSLFMKYREVQIEKDASNKAVEFMREILSDKELSLAKEFLDSARLTYWAVFFRTLLGWTFLTKKDSIF